MSASGKYPYTPIAVTHNLYAVVFPVTAVVVSCLVLGVLKRPVFLPPFQVLPVFSWAISDLWVNAGNVFYLLYEINRKNLTQLRINPVIKVRKREFAL